MRSGDRRVGIYLSDSHFGHYLGCCSFFAQSSQKIPANIFMNSVNIEKTVDFPFGFGRSKTVTVFEEVVAAGGPLSADRVHNIFDAFYGPMQPQDKLRSVYNLDTR